MKSSYASIKTLSFLGVDVIEVDVEVHISAGLPSFSIVGLPDKNISESKDRIRAAFSSLLLNFPNKRIIVNMSPSNLPKEGNHYDLPIAVGILVASGVLDKDLVRNWLVLGELSLDGSIKSAKGILLSSIYAHSKGYMLVTSYDSISEIKLSGNYNIIFFKNLLDIVGYKLGGSCYTIDDIDNKIIRKNYGIDMKDIKGQRMAKRAFEIAAVFRLNILMVGSPGVGKSMLAKRIITILPDLTSKEILETSMIYSVSDHVKYDFSIPYRNPHHSCSSAALLGGGLKCNPGEVSLSHNGVLFLDELAEFNRSIEGLRECMETNEIILSRANYHIRYPARCQVIAAMNPCKCGYFGTLKQCSKVPNCSKEYIKRISGPLLERFNIVLFMLREDTYECVEYDSSEVIKLRIAKARDLYIKHYKKNINDLNPRDILITSDALSFLEQYVNKHLLSHRLYDNFLKIALSIVLLEGKVEIEKHHIAESVMYKLDL